MDKMTDEQLLSELAIRLNSLEAVAERDEVATSIVRCSEIVKALSESRKGMFTEKEVINLLNSEPFRVSPMGMHPQMIRQRFLEKILTERKGRR